MVETPSTLPATTYTVGSFALAGSFLGMPYEGILLGIVGGVLFLLFNGPKNTHSLVATLSGSAMVAGLGAPAVAEILVGDAGLDHTNPLTLQRFFAFALGGSWLILMPILMHLLGRLKNLSIHLPNVDVQTEAKSSSEEEIFVRKERPKRGSRGT